MAFSIPSIADIGKRAKNAFRSFLPGTDAWIEPNNLSVTSRVMSLLMFEGYQRLQYLYKQLFASTADAYHLEFRHGYEFNITRKASIAAVGKVTLTQQVTTGGVVLPAGLRLSRGDGVTYQTTEPAIFSGGSATVAVRAEQSGASTNFAEGAGLELETRNETGSLVKTAVVAAGGIGGGADPESDDRLRARILFRKRNPPHGGAASDYVIWATEVPGCTRCFVAPFTNSSGAVTLYPLFDETRVNGIPVQADLDAVAEHIGTQSLEGVRPVTSRVYPVAAIPHPVDIEIDNLSVDTASTRRAIAEQIAAMFAERIPVSTAAEPFVLPLSWISEAISRATGETRHTLNEPSTDLVITAGRLPIPGTISFV